MSVSQVPATHSRARPRERTGIGKTAVGVPGVVILALLMAAVALFALYGLWRFWPAPAAATGRSPAPATFSYLGWQVSLTRDQQFFVIVALAGAIGAMLHGLRSLSTYIGEQYLYRSWIPYYALLPLVGALIATIVYLVLRAGLLPGGTSAAQPDPYGISAIGALVGLFSAQAAEKLKAVFETLFTKAETGDKAITDVTVPAITSFRPSSGKAGTPIVITGENLTAVTSVEFTNADAPNFKRVSEKQLNVSVPKGAATGPITLHAGQEHVTSGEDFTVTKWLPGRGKPRGG
jgi:IPT/TIG domain-containing protein